MEAKPLSFYAKNPYWAMIFLLAANAAAGVLFWKLPPFSYAVHIITVSASTLIFDVCAGYFKHKKLLFPKSGLITGLILANITSPAQLHIALLASLAAIASKQFIRFKRRHILNPAAMGALAMAFFGPGVSWWVANPLSFTFLYPAFLARRLYLSLTFFTLWLAFHLASDGQLHILNWSLAFFSFAMATDPATTPAAKKAQIAGGFILAVLVTLFSAPFESMAFLIGLLAVNIIRKPLDRMLK